MIQVDDFFEMGGENPPTIIVFICPSFASCLDFEVAGPWWG